MLTKINKNLAKKNEKLRRKLRWLFDKYVSLYYMFRRCSHCSRRLIKACSAIVWGVNSSITFLPTRSALMPTKSTSLTRCQHCRLSTAATSWNSCLLTAMCVSVSWNARWDPLSLGIIIILIIMVISTPFLSHHGRNLGLYERVSVPTFCPSEKKGLLNLGQWEGRSFSILQIISVLVQRYGAVLLRDTLPAPDCTD